MPAKYVSTEVINWKLDRSICTSHKILTPVVKLKQHFITPTCGAPVNTYKCMMSPQKIEGKIKHDNSICATFE